MNLTGQPIWTKGERAKKDPAYLKRVRQLPCVVCQNFGETQMSKTTAHHPICGRHGTARRGDDTAIPLCDGHHQGTFDTSKIAIHNERTKWVELYGEDVEYIDQVQESLLDFS